MKLLRIEELVVQESSPEVNGQYVIVRIDPENFSTKPTLVSEHKLISALRCVGLRLASVLEFMECIERYRYVGGSKHGYPRCFIDIDSPNKKLKKYLEISANPKWYEWHFEELRYWRNNQKLYSGDILCRPLN